MRARARPPGPCQRTLLWQATSAPRSPLVEACALRLLQPFLYGGFMLPGMMPGGFGLPGGEGEVKAEGEGEGDVSGGRLCWQLRTPAAQPLPSGQVRGRLPRGRRPGQPPRKHAVWFPCTRAG